MSFISRSLGLVLLGVALPISLVTGQQARAQVTDAQQRAVNVARMRAEAINGGLSRYRAARCMYSTSSGGGDCLVSTNDGYTFRFDGGAPGWQEAGEPASVETELKISPDGRQVEAEIYNGSPR